MAKPPLWASQHSLILEAGGGGGAPSRYPTPYPFMFHFRQKKVSVKERRHLTKLINVIIYFQSFLNVLFFALVALQLGKCKDKMAFSC